MRAFTLVMAYFENPQMLSLQLHRLSQLPLAFREHLTLIVIDDGSPAQPALPVFESFLQLHDRFTFPFQLWRMGVNVRWNQDACRNIGVREALTPWVVLTDMDHVVTEAAWLRLLRGPLDKTTAYRFARVSAPDLNPYKPHPNSWALTAKLYWKTGGYDEALAGNYGTDGDFRVRLSRLAPIQDLPEPLIRFPREVVADASTTTLKRKDDDDKRRISILIKARHTVPNWQPLHFSFPCERLL